MPAIKAVDAPVFSAAIDVYRNAIESWTQEILGPYLDWLDGAGAGLKTAKQFNDSVWGTIVLEAQEVVVLDSPLIQRLRRIRQLGVVHLVYPGANHTRFEHSLGVAHQVAQLAQSINRSAGDDATVVDSGVVDILRLAGLLHDVGHGLMSHVVENALVGNDEADALLLDFKKGLKRASKAQLSEMAAYFMISSPACAALLERAYAAAGRQAPDHVNATIARIVAGLNVSDDLPILHELISGPFDADKLDYMTRDARMCGVPVVTDVVRLTQKVRSVAVASPDLPEGMGRTITHQPTGHRVFGVARSGASALDEVSLNRSLMFDKVYRHHKVRAVEAMVGAAVQIVYPLFDANSALMPLRVMDDQFVELSRTDLERLNAAAGAPINAADLEVAIDITGKLRDRHLFNRAFAFAVTMPGDAYRDDRAHEAASEFFVRDLVDNAAKRRSFVDAIVKHVDKIATITADRSEVERIGIESLHHYIRVDPPAAGGRGSQSDQSRAFLVDESDTLLPVSKERGENRGWVDAYVNTKDVGFIFAPREIANMVHVASEVAARTVYGVRIPSRMHNYAKKGGHELADLRKRLQSDGFYDDLPRDLAPLPDFFNTVEAQQRVDTTLTNLRGYMGPTHRQESPGSSGSTLNETKIVRWAAQFPPEHYDNALRIAEHILMLDRDLANATLMGFKNQHPEYDGAWLVPMGESKDGSSIVAYHQRDSQADHGYELTEIAVAARDTGTIVFVDDFVGLGRSAVAIFKTYMGIDGGADLGEKRRNTLRDDEREMLIASKVALVWEAGFEEGAQHVVAELAQLGIQAEYYIHTPAETLPTVNTALHDVEPSELEAFLEVCRSIGRQLLAPDTDSGAVESRALGYGNFKLLITNSYNTPSVTLTALSRDGEVDGRGWSALIPRNKKT